MSALRNSYSSHEAAAADLVAHGFTNKGDFWVKPSMSGGNLFSAPAPMTALCTIKHQHVDPRWNAPDYFTVKFH